MTIMNTRHGESVMLLQGGNGLRKKGGMRSRGIVATLIRIANMQIVRMSARRRLVSHLKNIHIQIGFISLEFSARYDDGYEERQYEAPAPVAVDTSMTGDEAYQRRLALSRGHNVPSRTPPVVAETGEEAYLRRAALSQQTVAEVQREPSPALAYNPFAPPTNVPPPPPAPTSAEYEARLRQSREAAAAIVAKLAASASRADTDPTPPDNILTESSEM